MQFDSARRRGPRGRAGQLDNTIVHEMGHILGIGTIWTRRAHRCAARPIPRFVGPAAIGASGELGGTGSMPVENSGGPGTADSHWRESVFDNELMTGWLNVIAPMSQLHHSLAGRYRLRRQLAAADAYVRPSALRLLSLQAPPIAEMDPVDRRGLGSRESTSRVRRRALDQATQR